MIRLASPGKRLIMALIASALTVVGIGSSVIFTSAPKAHAADPVNCSTLYALNQSSPYNIYSVDMSTGARTTLFNQSLTLPSTTRVNGLAIDPRNGNMYEVSQDVSNQTSATIYQIDPVSQATTVVGTVPFPKTPTGLFGGSSVPPNQGVVMGAVSDAGILYFGFYDTNNVLHILGFNLDTDQPLTGEVGQIPDTNGDGNGDFAFDASGNLWIVTGTSVMRTETPLPTTGGTGAQLAVNTWAVVDGLQGALGSVAIGPDGYIYAGSNTTVYKINPSEPQQVTQLPSTDTGDFADMASCSAMNVLTVQKDLPNGRAASGDQFNLNIAYDGSTAATATTTGTDSGMQSDAAELAVLGALPSGGYDISETPAAGTSMSNYSSSYECTAMGADPSGPAGTLVPITGWSASGTGTSGTIQFPSYPSGATDAQWATGIQVTCTFTNTLQQPITLTKTASPTTVQNVGDEVNYTFNVTNSGDAPLSDVNVTDPMTAAGLTLTGCDDLGTLQPGDSATCTGTYAATTADFDAGSIKNTATATGTTPDNQQVTGEGSATVAATRSTAVNCSTLYALQQESPWSIYSVDMTTGARTALFNQSGNTAGMTTNITVNGLAIDPRNGNMYDVSQNMTNQISATIYQIDPVSQTTTVVGTVPFPTITTGTGVIGGLFGGPTYLPNSGVVMGAVSDAGILYIGYYDTSYILHILGFNLDTEQPLTGEVGEVGAAAGGDGSGDFAFDATGNLWIVTSNQILRTLSPLSTTGGTGAQLAVETWATVDMSTSFDSVAVGPDGYIYAGSGSARNGNGLVYKINPSEPQQVTQLPSTDGGDFTDFASCSAMNVLTVQKNLPNGRAASSDQFNLNIAYDGQNAATATTTGTDSGVQSDAAELAVVGALPSGGYDISETPAAGTSMDAYSSSYECTAMGADPSGPVGTLVPIAGWSASGTGTSGTIQFPSYPATATDAQWATGIQVTCTFTNTPGQPGISVKKTASPTTVQNVGDEVTYTFDVTNSGSTPLSGVNVTDSMPGLVIDPSCANLGSLDVGASTSCTATYTVKQSDLDKGSITNNATATGTPPDGPAVSGSDSITVDSTGAGPAISLAKTASPSSVSAVGDVVTYTLTATNTGGVSLTGVKITDTMAGLVPDPSCANLGTLAPGASTSCTATYTVTQADLDNGGINNTATATATPPSGPDITGTGTADVTTNDNPQLKLVKTADKTSFSAVGDVITYTFAVTNTGNVTLTGVAVNDPLLGSTPPAGCSWATLAAGASVSCTATYSVTQADLDKGSVTNAASVSGNPPTGGPTDGTDTVTVPADDQPGLTLKKTADKTSFQAVGDVITYTFVVTNTGNVTLTGVAVNDPLLGSTPPAGCSWATLAAGALVSCTATYSVTQADLDKGSVTNAATVAGNPPTGGPTDGTDTVTTPATQEPSLTILKTADAPKMPAVGQPINYTFLVTNNGNVTVDNVTVTDPKAGLTLTGCSLGTLAPGDSTTCTGTYTVTQPDVDAGSITNTASVTGDTPSGGTPGDDSTVTVTSDGAPSIQLVKTASLTGVAKAGDTMTYTFDVTNTGNLTLTGVTVTDPMSGLTLDGCDFGTLAPGQHVTCTGTYTVSQPDIDGGFITNTATATGQPPTGDQVTDNATVTTNLPVAPKLSISKSVDTTDVTQVGQVLTYTFTATNTGNVTLDNVNITDDALPGIVLNGCDAIGVLAPSASASCTGTYTVQAADLDAGSLTNVAVGHATTPPTPGGPTPPPQIPDVPSNPVTATDQDAIIGNFVWDDLNGNGIQDPGEPGIAGVAVTLVRPNTDGTSQTYQTVTAANGHYTLSAPPSGDTGYTITFQIPTGMVATAPNQGTPGNDSVIDATGTVADVVGVGGQTNNDVDAGFYTPVNVNGVVWNDVNHDGTMDDGETFASGVTVTVTGTDGLGNPVTQTTTSDNTGAYQLLVPPSGPNGYVVTVTAPNNTVFTDEGKGTNGANPTIGSDVDPATGASDTITVTSGDASVVNAGLVGSNLVVTKTADPASGTAVTPGETVTYQLTFSNPAPAAPADLQYADDLTGVVDDATVAMAGISVTPASSCTDPANAIPGTCQAQAAGVAVNMSADGSQITITGTLQPGTVLTVTYRATVTGSLRSGDHSLVNTLTSTGPGPKEPPIVTDNPVSQILLVKEGNVLDGKSGTEGDTIAYKFTITNVGTMTLHDVQLTDGHAGLSTFVFGSWPGDAGVLTPGQSVTATALYQVTDADVLAGAVENTANVTGIDDQGNNVTCDSSSSVPLAAHPSIVFAKTVSAVDGSTVAVGDQLDYTFTVTNTGDITLNNVRVSDPMAGLSDIVFNWPGQPGVLSPGQSVVAKAAYQVTAADVSAGHVNNTAISYADIPGWQPGDSSQPPSSVPSPEVSATASATYDIPPAPLMVQTGGNLSDPSGLAALALALLLAAAVALIGSHRARERGWCPAT